MDATSLSGLVADWKQLPVSVRINDTGEVPQATAPLVGAAETILARAREQDGLRLTPSGFLNLRDVAAIFDAMPWDEAQKDMIRHVCRVIHEGDFTALGLTRMILQKAGFLYRRKDHLICRKGTRHAGAHYAEIVASAFWRTDLSEFDGVPLPHWPQDHIGVTLWAISACGMQWSQPRQLMTLTTLSHPTLERLDRNSLLAAFQLRVLRPLVWLGLLEMEPPWDFSASSTVRVRKTPLFDQTFAFDVSLREQPTGQVH
ncbi:MAG TPA: hypothetical protein VLQ65_15955 [Saliniramus sp.]|nr:hypothetical protein [Saliniramus sp.]